VRRGAQVRLRIGARVVCGEAKPERVGDVVRPGAELNVSGGVLIRGPTGTQRHHAAPAVSYHDVGAQIAGVDWGVAPRIRSDLTSQPLAQVIVDLVDVHLCARRFDVDTAC